MTDIQPGEIWNRNDFGTLCEWRRLYRAIEIGVDKADFSAVFMNRCQNFTLYLGIDPYGTYPEMEWGREADLYAAAQRFTHYGSRARLIRSTSEQTAKMLIESESQLYHPPYDFIYLDGDHSEEAVYSEMVIWWDFLSPRGILAGHDWWMKTDAHPGVRKSVERFANERNLTIYYTWLDDPQSWYIYKSGLPGEMYERTPDDRPLAEWMAEINRGSGEPASEAGVDRDS